MMDNQNRQPTEHAAALDLAARLTTGLHLAPGFLGTVERLLLDDTPDLKITADPTTDDMDALVRKVLFSLSHDHLVSGRHHTGQGALSPLGRDMLLLNEKCADYFVRNGIRSREAIDIYRQDLYATLEQLV